MERPNTVSGLMEKHREIAGQLDAAKKQLNRLAADLEAVEHTIRLFDPDAKLPRAKPVHTKHAAFKGEMRSYVLTALRNASGPLTNLEIAKAVIVARGLDANPKTVVMIRKRVGACMSRMSRLGWVKEVPMAGEYKGWARV